MRVQLKIYVNDLHQRDILLDKNGYYVIGRVKEADIRVDDDQLSRMHCAVLIMGKSAMIEDVGSSNGTMVNGVRLQMESRSAAMAAGHDQTSLVTPLDPAGGASRHPVTATLAPQSVILMGNTRIDARLLP